MSVEALGGGRYRVGGALTFDAVLGALEQMRGRFAGDERIEIDLAGVSAADSAGLALLIEWYGWAARANKTIRFVSAPPPLRALAKISDMEELLGLNDASA